MFFCVTSCVAEELPSDKTDSLGDPWPLYEEKPPSIRIMNLSFEKDTTLGGFVGLLIFSFDFNGHSLAKGTACKVLVSFGEMEMKAPQFFYSEADSRDSFEFIYLFDLTAEEWSSNCYEIQINCELEGRQTKKEVFSICD